MSKNVFKLFSKDETILKSKKYCKKVKDNVQWRGEKYGEKYKPNTKNER